MMNKKFQNQAELVALVQRHQLNCLQQVIHNWGKQLTQLENESVSQSTDLDRLRKEIAKLRGEHSIDAESTISQIPDHRDHHVSDSSFVQKMQFAKDPSDQLPPMIAPPSVGEDWNLYIKDVNQYIADHGIDVAPDPLEQLLPSDRVAAIRDEFVDHFCPAPWDRWDYSAVALAVILGAVTDYLLVATPGGIFKGEEQRASPVTQWMKQQSQKIAPIQSGDTIERNAFQQWLAELTTTAEKWAKVPYDRISPKDGLTPRTHRLASLGHDPILGLIFGVMDIISGKCTFIDPSGAWKVIDNPQFSGTPNPVEALVKVVFHGFSDVFTKQGLPIPFMASFLQVSANSGFTVKEGGDALPVKDVIKYMYANGYDLRHFVTTAISPGIAEALLWTYHGIRAYATGSKMKEAGISEKMKQKQMLVMTHALLGSANIMKTALYGWNPLAINFAQFKTLALRMISLVKLSLERDQMVQNTLNQQLDRIISEARILN